MRQGECSNEPPGGNGIEFVHPQRPANLNPNWPGIIMDNQIISYKLKLIKKIRKKMDAGIKTMPTIIGVPRGEDGGNEADVPGQEKGGWGKRHG